MYYKFLNVLKEPLEKTQKRSLSRELWDVVSLVRSEALNAFAPFILITFFSTIFLLIILQDRPLVVPIIYALLVAYFVLFFLSFFGGIYTAVRNFFKPWNQFIHQENLSRESPYDEDVSIFKDRLIENFLLNELLVISKRTNKDFNTYNDKWKDMIELSTRCVVIFTVLTTITKDFTNEYLNSRSMLLCALFFGFTSLIMVLYRTTRETKFKKMLSSIEQAITHLSEDKDDSNIKRSDEKLN